MEEKKKFLVTVVTGDEFFVETTDSSLLRVDFHYGKHRASGQIVVLIPSFIVFYREVAD